jgi:hypothetical protein
VLPPLLPLLLLLLLLPARKAGKGCVAMRTV